MPPTKSCGPLIHFGMMDSTGPWLGASVIDFTPRTGRFAQIVWMAADAACPGLA
jgi:hypothetical protein